MKYLPVFLNLRNRPVLFIGNGLETREKLLFLVETGAKVNVVSPEPLPVMHELVQTGKITLRSGAFRDSDVENVWLAMSSSNDRGVNERVSRACEARQIFYNCVDVIDLCAFISPAIINHGDVSIAISTGGASPALAQRLKREISGLIGPEYGDLGALLGRTRPGILREISDRETRFRLFHQMVDSDLLDLFRSGKHDQATKLAQDMIDRVIEQKHPHKWGNSKEEA